VQIALTSEACLKGLPKTTAGEVVAFKGWPKLQWFVTEHLGKTPKDWSPPPRLTDDTPAYIEVLPSFLTGEILVFPCQCLRLPILTMPQRANLESLGNTLENEKSLTHLQANFVFDLCLTRMFRLDFSIRLTVMAP